MCGPRNFPLWNPAGSGSYDWVRKLRRSRGRSHVSLACSPGGLAGLARRRGPCSSAHLTYDAVTPAGSRGIGCIQVAYDSSRPFNAAVAEADAAYASPSRQAGYTTLDTGATRLDLFQTA